jgi:hypothetical protein
MLSTLKNQEIFDKVVNHLRRQKKQALACPGGACVYRTKDKRPLRCAAGFLIPAREYEPEFERCGSISIEDIKRYHSKNDLSYMSKVSRYFALRYNLSQCELISSLQKLHDGTSAIHGGFMEGYESIVKENTNVFNMEVLEAGIKRLAEKHNLDYNPPKKGLDKAKS